jgi:hypothetical protein
MYRTQLDHIRSFFTIRASFRCQLGFFKLVFGGDFDVITAMYIYTWNNIKVIDKMVLCKSFMIDKMFK